MEALEHMDSSERRTLRENMRERYAALPAPAKPLPVDLPIAEKAEAAPRKSPEVSGDSPTAAAKEW
jgi:hypothetical protein